MSANYELRGNVAVITLNNPPVNGLGYETRKAIVDGLERAQADAAVKAIVITGAGKAFSGGADIREFGSPKALAEPNLLTVIRACELSSKPIVAAIHTVCMGGGLELALGCPRKARAIALPRPLAVATTRPRRRVILRAEAQLRRRCVRSKPRLEC